MFYDIHLGTCFFLNFGLPWVLVAVKAGSQGLGRVNGKKWGEKESYTETLQVVGCVLIK